MSDSFPRRQPPSPLIFQPEHVLPSIQTQASQPPTAGANLGSGSLSGANTVSMPFIKRHVTRRLKAAKQECDKDLQQVTNAITAFFEERLRDGDVDQSDAEHVRDATAIATAIPHPPQSAAAAIEHHRSTPVDESTASDAGYDAEPERERNHSRQRASLLLVTDAHQPIPLTRWASSPGDSPVAAASFLPPPPLSSSASVSSSSASLHRQNTVPKEKVGANPLASASSPALAAPADGSSPRRKRSPSVNISNNWLSQASSRASRRLSRAIHIPLRSSRSGQSSRSTSRSRSPLPSSSRTDVSDHPVSRSPNRRASRILVDDPVDPIMTTLYEIIGVATDITEMSISQLTSQPKLCSQLVQRVQQIGRAWDEHPDWHGRNWYVQVLLAVASLSRVVEWWEAEKQFWNFDDEGDEEESEPFAFLLKPADDHAPTPAPTPTTSLGQGSDTLRQLSLAPDEDPRLRMSRATSHPGTSREEARRPSATVPRESDFARAAAKAKDTTESARVLATERLRLQAEQAQSQNIVVELSLDGDHILWLNYAWATVVGSDPEAVAGTKLTYLLSPADQNVFRDATEQLLSDDSHTVEVRFKLQIETGPDSSGRGVLYREMEGKGMLMIDQVDGQPSHTMWVIKSIGPVAYDQPIGPTIEEQVAGEEEYSDEEGEIARALPTNFILCRICENNIPDWFFEKHNETCNDVHKFEAEIGECNESLAELRNTIRDLRLAIDRSTASNGVPEYRGMPILVPTTPPATGALHLFRPPLVSKMQRMSLKRMQRRLLEQLDDILLVAYEVGLPALREEEAKEPIERQRLVSPSSDRKITQVRSWLKPSTEDPALTRLINDAERLMRSKMDNVVRMQNTIRYSEKVRQEWEEKMEALTLQDPSGASESGSEDGHEREASDYDDHGSIKARYIATQEMPEPSSPVPVRASSSDPTPVASVTPATTSASSSRSSSVRLPTPVPMSAPSIFPAPSSSSYTRSSTPASISSPLALAAPIVASDEIDSDISPPPPSLEESPNIVVRKKSQTLERRKSQPLDPKVMITPPVSPSIAPRDSSNGDKRSRRLSTVNTDKITSPSGSSGPLSPRIPSLMPSRSTPTSIKDYEIIKPISKGAFGSVFLAKKRVTGDYYAIKVLKKADMIAKNQITNVKAERMILMNQAESPFVAKLYFTFQSKENLYLVMEYLNGGDCAALIKTLGELPEEWTRQYMAEVVLGLEYLHERGIVHRDLKPDNLLIDQHGHLKMTDFGLSRIGLLGRQTRDLNAERPRPRAARYSPGSRPPSMDAAYLSSPLLLPADILGGSYFTQRLGSGTAPSLAPSPLLTTGTPTDDISESSGSESLSTFFLRRSKDRESPVQSFATELTNDLRQHAQSPGMGTPPGDQKFVGTPDYLSPESILGITGDDAVVDWWALGVITYEFLYGIPPFHAETPEKVFENILSGHIDWHEEYIDFSPEALDFMKRLLTIDTSKRLGANGADEVKAHPWFACVEWDKVTTSEAAFIPQISDPESTDYFDLRGAVPQLFHEEEGVAVGESAATPGLNPVGTSSTATVAPISVPHRDTSSPQPDDFGSFSFKNLPVLKQHNDDVIRKLKSDQMAPMVHTLSEPAQISKPHRRSVSQRIRKPPSVVTQLEGGKPSTTNPPSPATSASSVASSPSRASMAAPSTPGSAHAHSHSHSRKPSEFGAVERFKQNHFDVDGLRRNSMPSRLRTASVSTTEDGSLSDAWPGSFTHMPLETTPPSSTSGSMDLRRQVDTSDRALTCLLAEDNPITAKIIETLLIRLGCRVVVVADGSEAISVAHGDIKFDCILMDLHMPVVDGESAARLIKSTTNKNSGVPIISVSAYSGSEGFASTLFAATLSKPVQKADLLAVMRQLGFKTAIQEGGAPSARVVTR